jgi:hypothetical protein
MFWQNESGVDYDDIENVMGHVPPNWWLEHEACKYILSIFVHKDNKDILSTPTRLPPGDSRKEARKKKAQMISDERVAAKAAHPVEKYGDVDHEMKKVRVDGMRSQVEKNIVEAIVSQINVMRDNAEIYIAMFGEEKYREKVGQLMNKLPGLGDNAGNGVQVQEVDLSLSDGDNDDNEAENTDEYGTDGTD